MAISKKTIVNAMSLEGLEDWPSSLDVPHLSRPRRRPAHLSGDGRAAAVLLLLYPNATNNYSADHASPLIVLTRRPDHLNKHAGQISLPGGQQDPGETLDETATREAEEEVGVSANKIELLGRLNPVYIPPSDFTVDPFVGWLPKRPEFVRSEAEVAEIIEVPLTHLIDPTTIVKGTIKTAKGSIEDVPYFRIQHHQVWGATALILGEFVERIKSVT
jgi:8-oxo-dGTP pyrophosphatase MutT (NUDIX family)